MACGLDRFFSRMGPGIPTEIRATTVKRIESSFVDPTPDGLGILILTCSYVENVHHYLTRDFIGTLRQAGLSTYPRPNESYRVSNMVY